MKTVIKKYLPLAFIFCVTLFFSTYKLTESPKTWMDEGIISQVSKNLADYNKHALQVAPETFESAGVVSTGFPVTFPISLSFKLFGVGILQERAVMVVFIIVLILLVFFYLKRHWGQKTAFWGALLLATFSPLYGHGKNVLGEVPGLVFFFLFLLFVDKIKENKNKYINYLMLGVFAGLVFSTKSIFILLLPAWVIVSFFQIYYKKLEWNKFHLLSIVSFFLVVLIWMLVQFSGDSLSHILSIYTNPYSVGIIESIKQNLYLFVSESQPIYFALALLIWVIASCKRIKNSFEISTSELIALSFSVLVFLAFFRTPGFYRYFFLAQFLSLVYLLPSLNYLFAPTRLLKYVVLGIVGLILFHTYQTSLNSWVADSYNGNRSVQISLHTKNISKDKKILFYQVPEFIIFLRSNDYYQYIDITSLIKVGKVNKSLVSQGFFDQIFVNSSVHTQNPELFKFYTKIDEFDSYAILKKK